MKGATSSRSSAATFLSDLNEGSPIKRSDGSAHRHHHQMDASTKVSPIKRSDLGVLVAATGTGQASTKGSPNKRSDG